MSTEPEETKDAVAWFSADRPITERSQDRLGRTEFAENLASAIQAWRGRESLVIALYGPWGSGKSSIKNMVVDCLRRSGTVTVVDFNPWQVANRDQLSESFFDELGVALGKGFIGSRKDRRALLNRWRRYGAALNVGSEVIAATKQPHTGLILAAIAFVGVANLSIDSAWKPWVTAVGVALSVIGFVMDRITGWLEIGVDVGRKPLEEVRNEVRSDLQSLSRPLLVIIDDLDRLTPTELAEQFQLVKANADSSNIVYLILCDRAVVADHIEKVISGAVGQQYLEKIVQLPFDVPVVEQKRLDGMLFEGLDGLLSGSSPVSRFNKQRWGNLYMGALRPFFATPRNVNRFLSTLSFHLTLLGRDGSLEVNPVDLIGLEVLRAFEPQVYHELSRHHQVLTSISTERSHVHQEAERAEVDGIVKPATEERRERVVAVLKQLFPTIEWAFGGVQYEGGFSSDWERELRVCSSKIFPRYFQLALPEGDIPQASLDRILASTNDHQALAAEFGQLASRGLLATALDRLEAYKEKIPLEHAEAWISAIFDAGDKLPADSGGMLDVAPGIHAQRLVYFCLKQIEDVGRRGEIVTAALARSHGVQVPVDVVSSMALALKETPPQHFVSPKNLAALKTLCVERIEARAEDGSLARSEALATLLFRWREWGDPDAVQQFVSRLIATDAGMLTMLRAFLYRSASYGMGDFVPQYRWKLALKNLSVFVGLDQIEQRVREMDESRLNGQERRAVESFMKAMEIRHSGRNEDDPFADSGVE